MFSIYDGRETFYQWDINRKLIVADSTIAQVHFANCLCANARICETYTEDGLTLVDVPNVLLTEYMDINVWGFDGEATKHSATFGVVKRTKPEEYVYTEEELKKWEEIYQNMGIYQNKEFGNGVDIYLQPYTNLYGLDVTIPVEQEGEGEPSLDNVRNFRTFDAIDIQWATDYDSGVMNVEFDNTVSGALIDCLNGKVFNHYEVFKLDLSKANFASYDLTHFRFSTSVREQGWTTSNSGAYVNAKCNCLPKANRNNDYTMPIGFYIDKYGVITFWCDNWNRFMDSQKEILSQYDIYFTYVVSNKITNFEPFHNTFRHDDWYFWAYVSSDIENEIKMNVSYLTSPSSAYEELSSKVTELEERLAELEGGSE